MATQPARPEHLLTPAEVAAVAFVDPKTVSRWAKAGRIPSTTTPGGHRRFRDSDVRALTFQGGNRQQSPDGRVDPPTGISDQGRAAVAEGEAGRAADHPAVAEVLARAREARSTAAAEAASATAASVVVAAETTARAVAKARRARAFAAAEAAQVIADEAAIAAAAMRSRATEQAGLLAEAAAQAKRLLPTSGGGPQATVAAVRMAETVQAAADVASADTALAAARVAQAVTDAAARVAVMVAAFDLAVERDAAAAAEALHEVEMQTARHLARMNDAEICSSTLHRSTRT